MKIEVHLLSQSKPCVYNDAVNAYQKDAMYCVQLRGGMVHKFVIANLFRVVESEVDKIVA